MRTRLALLALCLAPAVASAQDSNYWNFQYGTRSALMGGAVVGGVDDTSAGYYNPGALGMVEEANSVSITGNLYRYESVTLENGAGDGNDIDSGQVEAVPMLFSGMKRFEGLPDHAFGYTVLTRQQNSVNASARKEMITDVLKNGFTPGPEDYIGQYSFDSKLTEVWGGLSWAYRINPHLSVGLTDFFAVRQQRENQTILARAVNREYAPPFPVGATDLMQTIDYWNLRNFIKMGAAAEWDSVKFGLAATTRSWNISGDGTTAGDLTVVNVDVNGDGIPDSVVADDRQEDLDAEYRTPWSIAAGVQVEVTDTTNIAGTLEWFGGKGRYSVMNPEDRDFVRPVGSGLASSADILRVSDAAQAVVDWGVAVEQKLDDKYTAYVAFRADYTSANNDDSGDGMQINVSDWSIYTTTLGITRRGEHSTFGIGVEYGFGENDDGRQRVNFDTPAENNLMFGTPGDSKAKYYDIGILVGYTYDF